MLSKKIPTKAPETIGNRKSVFFFISLKKCKTALSNFSYKPKITQKTPLLIPGRIAPAPTKMPTKKFFKKITYFNVCKKKINMYSKKYNDY